MPSTTVPAKPITALSSRCSIPPDRCCAPVVVQDAASLQSSTQSPPELHDTSPFNSLPESVNIDFFAVDLKGVFFFLG
jgi:hypothetical protein